MVSGFVLSDMASPVQWRPLQDTPSKSLATDPRKPKGIIQGFA